MSKESKFHSELLGRETTIQEIEQAAKTAASRWDETPRTRAAISEAEGKFQLLYPDLGKKAVFSDRMGELETELNQIKASQTCLKGGMTANEMDEIHRSQITSLTKTELDLREKLQNEEVQHRITYEFFREASEERDSLKKEVVKLQERLESQKRGLLNGARMAGAYLKKELAEWQTLREVVMNVVPGLGGEGVEIPVTPESIKTAIEYLQSEWDDAERRIGELQIEVTKLRYSPTLATCDKGHRFHTTAMSPAENEQKWICPWCQIQKFKELAEIAKGLNESLQIYHGFSEYRNFPNKDLRAYEKFLKEQESK